MIQRVACKEVKVHLFICFFFFFFFGKTCQKPLFCAVVQTLVIDKIVQRTFLCVFGVNFYTAIEALLLHHN